MSFATAPVMLRAMSSRSDCARRLNLVRSADAAMSRRQKQLARLGSLEQELRQLLTKELERVSRGENTLFFTTVELNATRLPLHMLPPGTAALSELASQTLALRVELGEPTQGSIGELFRHTLWRGNDTQHHDRLGPIRKQANSWLNSLTRDHAAHEGRRISPGFRYLAGAAW